LHFSSSNLIHISLSVEMTEFIDRSYRGDTMKYMLMICALSLMLFGCNGSSSNSPDEATPTVADPSPTQTNNDILPSSLKRSYADGVGGGMATSTSYRMFFSFAGPPTGEPASSPNIRLNPTE
jgi:hypothetical protein